MVALLLFLPWRPSRNVASPFSSVIVCMSAPVSLMSPLLSHTDQKPARAGHLSKVVLITWCFIHYMVPLPLAVKAEMRRGGSGKPDYRNRCRLSLYLFMCQMTVAHGTLAGRGARRSACAS